MRNIILVIFLIGAMTGCTVSSSESHKDTSYTLDTINPR